MNLLRCRKLIRKCRTVWRTRPSPNRIAALSRIRVITKLPNSEQSFKGKVKTHNYINRQNQSTTGKLLHYLERSTIIAILLLQLYCMPVQQTNTLYKELTVKTKTTERKWCDSDSSLLISTLIKQYMTNNIKLIIDKIQTLKLVFCWVNFATTISANLYLSHRFRIGRSIQISSVAN